MTVSDEQLGILIHTVVPSKPWVRSSRLQDDLGMDSLDQVELIMEAEREFEIEISDAVCSEIFTVGDLAREIDRLVDAQKKG